MIWQPIETAPRIDGEVILCWTPGAIRPFFLRWYDAHPRHGAPGWENPNELDESYHYNVFPDDRGSGEDAPTHWLELPRPPSQTSAQPTKEP